MSRTSPGASPAARTVGEALPEAATDWAERRTKAVHLLALGALRHARQRAAASGENVSDGGISPSIVVSEVT